MLANAAGRTKVGLVGICSANWPSKTRCVSRPVALWWNSVSSVGFSLTNPRWPLLKRAFRRFLPVRTRSAEGQTLFAYRISEHGPESKSKPIAGGSRLAPRGRTIVPWDARRAGRRDRSLWRYPVVHRFRPAALHRGSPASTREGFPVSQSNAPAYWSRLSQPIRLGWQQPCYPEEQCRLDGLASMRSRSKDVGRA